MAYKTGGILGIDKAIKAKTLCTLELDSNLQISGLVSDYFSLDDWNYSQILHTIEFGSGFYDWTHSNAIWYDQIDNSILLSVRYLSRITKIDYSTGNIIWNMGRQIESGDVEIGNDLGFSYLVN